ncbi:MAG: hypothetical protein M1838_001007 [Thelocarpon superellum]|nr:MAG: hypothetical protein M1838_001007 [Thelocarpon superellum]
MQTALLRSSCPRRWTTSIFLRVDGGRNLGIGELSRRHESSYRRTKRRLRVKPDTSFVSSASGPMQDHIIFNPPSSAPSVYNTPAKFIPKGDRRHELLSTSSDTSTPPASTRLPPPVRKAYEKRYHLTEQDMAEIRRLRTEDPEKWSRDRLAKHFDCSALFVGIVCEASKEHKSRQSQILDAVKSRWGRIRRTAREDRRLAIFGTGAD